MADVLLFVPGFFGFGAFGHRDRPLVEYFARVEDALLRALPAGARPVRFAVHEPPPAASLADRARSLLARATEILAEGATRLWIVGHSTGGLDARLLANACYGALPARADLLSRIAGVITLSAPFHGTPLAARLQHGSWVAMPALWFGSILASRGRLRIAGQLGALYTLAKRFTLRRPTPTDLLIAELADVDEETAHQIRRFLADVAGDHRLVGDLSPDAMGELNRQLEGGDVVGVDSFVSVAPAPGWGPSDALAFWRAPAERLLYDVAHALTSAPPPAGVSLPAGPWIGARRVPIQPRSNDGIVPAWSQTLSGSAAGIVAGDHLDVIGHYEGANATFLSSGSRFDAPRFRALWSAVAGRLKA